jgi:hypothetical protein
MRVAWVHPTWRDLVIERLAGDAQLRRHFLAHCGPHGIALALSTGGGARGERQLPLICDDEDWDAVGDRIYALAPDLEHAEAAAVLTAVRGALHALVNADAAADEARALARTALDRTASVWQAAHTPVTLECVDAWLLLTTCLDPPVWPRFLAMTWAELLPTDLPDPGDLTEAQRFTDWIGLCDSMAGFSPKLLAQLGYGEDHDKLVRAFRNRSRDEPERVTEIIQWRESEERDARAQRDSDHLIRRVLADL